MCDVRSQWRTHISVSIWAHKITGIKVDGAINEEITWTRSLSESLTVHVADEGTHGLDCLISQTVCLTSIAGRFQSPGALDGGDSTPRTDAAHAETLIIGPYYSEHEDRGSGLLRPGRGVQTLLGLLEWYCSRDARRRKTIYTTISASLRL